MATSVTIDGPLLGRLTQQFATMEEAFLFVLNEARKPPRRAIVCDLILGPCPEWGLPNGGTYHLSITRPDGDGEAGWEFSLVTVN